MVYGLQPDENYLRQFREHYVGDDRIVARKHHANGGIFRLPPVLPL
jgi:hypothetical protein